MSTLLVPVMDRYAKAWPRHGDKADCAEPFTFERAFSERFDDDPHFTAYAPVDDHRLDHGAIGRVSITMQLFVVDVEPPGHAPRTPEWDADQQPRIERAISLGAFYYATRGGYRLVWRLAEPFAIASKQDAQDWSASYLAALDEIERELGIVGDRTCKDWTRLYRLPFVTRDGVPQEPATGGVLGPFALDRVAAPAHSTSIAPVPSDTAASPDMIERARDRLRRHGPAIEGQHGDQHTFEACAIVVRDCGLDDAAAWSLLTEWNAKCQPPWGEDELRAKMDNAFNYGTGEFGSERSNVAIAAGLARALERKPDTSAPPTTTIDELIALPTIIANTATEGEEYGSSSLAAFLGEDDPGEDPDAWLIPGIMPAGVPTIIAGHPKSCKIFLAEHKAICIAAGIDWKLALRGQIGYPARRGRVLVLAREDSVRETRRRIWRLARGLGLDPRALVDWLRIDCRTPFYFDKPDDVDRMRRTIERWRPVLIVIDSLSRTHTGDENSKKEMSIVTSTWGDLCQEYDSTVAPIHHYTKAGEGRLIQRLRGTGDLGALLRHAIGVTKRDDGTTELEFDGNLHPLPEPFLVRMVDATTPDGKPCIRFEEVGTAKKVNGSRIDNAILAELAEAGNLTAREIEQRVKGNAAVIRARRDILRDAGRIRYDNVIKRYALARTAGVRTTEVTP